ncbi:ABC transporter ATP-binding protein [Coriobacteriaceae bacterium]|nr:ABC transporter ATP-binding protein [Coriobacteriaceae bacterium]
MAELARRFFGPYRRWLVLGPLMKTLEVVFDLLTPLVIAWMIDSGVRRGDASVVTRGAVALVAFAFCGFGFTLVCQKMASLASQGMGTDIRRELFAAVNRFSFADVDRFGTPSLITRITNDVNQLQVAVAMLIRQVIRWPVLAVGAIVCALALDPVLGSVFCLCLPATLLVFYLVMRRSIPYFVSMQAKLDRIGTIVREALAGVRVVRAFSREGFEERRFERAATDQAADAVAAGRLSALLNPATFLILNVGVCAILWLGAGQVFAGDLEQGELMALIGYMNQVLVSVAYIANLVVIFTRAQASAGRVAEVLDWEPTVRDPGGPVPAPVACAPAVAFEGVSFTYPGGGRPALDGITVSIGPGEVLGVIGGTGSGKSTLADLVGRFYDVSSGSVSVLGTDVHAWPFAGLRSAVSFVPQESALLSGTIRGNLLWRDGSATDDELWEALERAQAADFVRGRPEGLDAPVEAGGRNFSGGQRQRLCIARALVGSPQVLVMDDAASALDFATDARLRVALGSWEGGPARIVVSQRVASVRHADRILVLDRGRVAGLGTHAELVETCPVYRETCLSQLEREEVLA